MGALPMMRQLLAKDFLFKKMKKIVDIIAIAMDK
jgi:hypothetical protein